MSYKKRKTELNKLIKEITNRPYTLALTANNHYCIKIQGIRPIYTGSTPSDYRGNLNLSRDIRLEFRNNNISPMSVTTKHTLVVMDEPATETPSEPEQLEQGTKEDKAKLEHTVARLINAYGLDLTRINHLCNILPKNR